MARITYWSTLTVLCTVAAALPAHAQFWAPALSWFDGDNAASVMADCGQLDLPDDSVDRCLERARLVDESHPSPQLQTLEVQLERRADTADDGPASSAADAPRSLRAPPAATQALPATTGAGATAASPDDASDDDPPVPDDKGASKKDDSPDAAAPAPPQDEVSGADDEVPSVDDGDDDDSDAPATASAAPHATAH